MTNMAFWGPSEERIIGYKVCDCGNGARFICVQCQEDLCRVCKSKHLRRKGQKNHEIIFSEIGKTSGQFSCIHTGEILNYRCITCEKPICQKCTTDKHRFHNFTKMTINHQTKEKHLLSHVIECDKKLALCQTSFASLQKHKDAHAKLISKAMDRKDMPGGSRSDINDITEQIKEQLKLVDKNDINKFTESQQKYQETRQLLHMFMESCKKKMNITAVTFSHKINLACDAGGGFVYLGYRGRDHLPGSVFGSEPGVFHRIKIYENITEEWHVQSTLVIPSNFMFWDAVICNDALYVTYTQEGQIRKLEAGKCVTVVGMLPLLPFGICKTHDNDLLVSVFNMKKADKSILRITTSGHILKTYDNSDHYLFTFPDLLTENINEDICFTDSVDGMKSVVVLDHSGNKRFRYPGIYNNCKEEEGEDFYGIACDHQGNILVSDDKRKSIHLLDINGQFIKYITLGHIIDSIGRLHVDKYDRIWVAAGKKALMIKDAY